MKREGSMMEANPPKRI